MLESCLVCTETGDREHSSLTIPIHFIYCRELKMDAVQA